MTIYGTKLSRALIEILESFWPENIKAMSYRLFYAWSSRVSILPFLAQLGIL